MFPEDYRTKQRYLAGYSRPNTSSLITCARHGWSALGHGCPECRDGDAPRSCAKHGWAHMSKGCPDCAAGKP